MKLFNWLKTARSRKILRGIVYGIGLLCLGVGSAYAQTSGGSANLGDIAANVTGSFLAFGKLLIATSYIAGIGFAIAGIFKFKQHKDNPTQIPLGTPIALIVISICLVFLPGFFKPAGSTLFGSNGATAGGFTGAGVSTLPGANGGGSSSTPGS